MTPKATNFTEAVRIAAGKRKADALAEYRRIVTRCESPRKGDADKLADLLPVLGLTPEQVEHDIEAVRKVADIKRAVTEIDDRAGKVEVAARRLKAHDDETFAIEAAHRDQLAKRFADRLRLVSACELAGSAHRQAVTGKAQAEQVKADHPRLYGDAEAVLNPSPSVTPHETIHVGPREPGPPIVAYDLDMGTGTMVETPAA